MNERRERLSEEMLAALGREESEGDTGSGDTTERAPRLSGRRKGQRGKRLALLDRVWFHPVLAAIHMAFDEHRPLTLSPDMIWLMIAQGFAHQVNENAETLRDRFGHIQGRRH